MKMPVKTKPYSHQQEAFEFACGLFGVTEGGDALPLSRGCFYLMDMG